MQKSDVFYVQRVDNGNLQNIIDCLRGRFQSAGRDEHSVFGEIALLYRITTQLEWTLS